MAYEEENQKQPEMADQSQEQISKDDPMKPIQLPEEKVEACLDELMSLFDKWDMWRRPYETIWDEIYRLYMSTMASTKTPTRAKIFVPITFTVIENAVAKFVSLIFNQEEFFEVIPTDPKDQAQAEVITKLLMYQLRRADFFLKFIDFVKQMILYGTSYMKVYWKVKRQWVWEREPVVNPLFSIMGFQLGKRIVGWKETKEYKVVERRPEIDVLDILDVYPDPQAKNPQEGRGVFMRSWMSLDEVKIMGKGKYPVYSNTEDPRLINEIKETVPARVNRFSVRGVSEPSHLSKGRVEILEFWGCYDVDGDGIKEEALITIANRKVILRAVPNPFHHQKRPIVKSVMFPVPLEWFGLGMIEPIIPLQHELNTLRRQRLDNINLNLNRMWKVNSLADVDVDTLVSTPNGIVLTDDMQAVDIIPTPDSTSAAYQEAQIVQADIENVTVPRSVQGIPDSGRLGRTARGAQLIIGQALEKFGLAAKLLEESCIKRVLRLFHQLNLQFIDSEDVAKETGIVGSIFDEQISTEMIRSEVQFRMIGVSDMIGSEAKINQIVSYVGVFKDVLVTNPETISTIAKKVWGLMGFDKDEINIGQPGMATGQISGDPQQQQNIEAAIQAQAQQNGGTAAAPSIPGVRPPNA